MPEYVQQKLRGRKMLAVDGGTQALRRTMIYTATGPGGASYDISVPDELGALVLKGAAHMVDSRDTDRHLFDAAVLSACITDHASEIERLAGSDRNRIATWPSISPTRATPRGGAWTTGTASPGKTRCASCRLSRAAAPSSARPRLALPRMFPGGTDV